MLMTGGREVSWKGEVDAWIRDIGRCLLFLLSLSLSPPQTLPSADLKSCFDWISHELMRQA